MDSSPEVNPPEQSPPPSSTPKIPIARLLRRSLLRTALIPLLAVEIVLVVAFFFTHQVSTSTQISVQRADAKENLVRLVQSRSEVIAQELQTVQAATELYQRQTAAVLATPARPSASERRRYERTPEGALVTDQPGGAAAYYSNITTVGAEQWKKIWRTAHLDPLMRDLVESHELITQVYFNSFDSYNRIYPYRQVAQQYAPDMDIPSYSFYYRADAQHNPEARTLWTDAYLDPAGQGWMVSCVAPVYRHGFLEGVVGSDVTLSVLIDQILSKQVPWHGYAMLIDKNGTILAMPPQAEADWHLLEKTQHAYVDFVREDTFKPEEFNLFQSPDLAQQSGWIQGQFSDVKQLTLAGQNRLAAWSHVRGTDWTYLMIVPEQAVFARIQDLADSLHRLGQGIIAGMLLFYTLFLAYLLHSSYRLSQQLAQPLQEIEGLVSAIATGNYQPDAPQLPIAELNHTAHRVVEMGRKLGEQTTALTHALQVKSRFLAVVSHELRTPLNGILGMGELMRQGPLTQAQQGYLAAIMGSGENLLRLLNDILDMSCLEARAIDLKPAPLNLHELIETQVAFWQPAIEQKGLSFSWHLDPALPRCITADPDRLRQMLNNYFSNALKFTDAGSICLHISRRLTSASQDSAPATIRFAVKDTGAGISPEHLKQLFQPFCQVDSSRQRLHAGTGLGLSIVQELAYLMGGTVGVDSASGEGASFWFEIPIVPAAPETVPPPPSSAQPLSQTTISPLSLRVLLAEDNPVNQKLAVACLQRFGISYDVAANGLEAVRLFQQSKYDLVLMDIHMPCMDGVAAMHAIRKANPQVVVVAITADAYPETCQMLIKEGFNAYLTKPYRFVQIQEILLSIAQNPNSWMPPVARAKEIEAS